jgi:hypothetical protein
MRKKKAILILNQQSNKLKQLELFTTHNWTVETQAYLSEFFGKSSHESEHFRMNLTDIKSEQKKEKIIDFLNNCVNVISNKGLYKLPKQNILNRIPDWSIIPIITGLFFIGGVFGRYQKDISFIRMEKRIEILRDSIFTISTNNISDKVKPHTNNQKLNKLKPQ